MTIIRLQTKCLPTKVAVWNCAAYLGIARLQSGTGVPLIRFRVFISQGMRSNNTLKYDTKIKSASFQLIIHNNSTIPHYISHITALRLRTNQNTEHLLTYGQMQ